MSDDEKKSVTIGEAPQLAARQEQNTVDEKNADATLRFMDAYGHTVEPLTAAEQRTVTRKLHIYITALIVGLNLVLFVDKATLSYASILGLFEETGINDTQYNNLNSIFYTGYILAQWPGNYLMQKLPFGRFVGGTVFVWSVIVFLHCACTNYSGLIAARFFLGATESILVPAMEITLGMFFIREEQSFLQPIFWTTCLGAPIPAGFLAYGLLYTNSAVRPWKFFMIITGIVTFLVSVYCWFFYPSNPAEAKFFTTKEKVYIIKRVQESSQSSIEQKQFKKAQFIETLKDPVSWLFLLQAFTLMVSNNLSYQQNLLFVSLGVGNLGSTLVSVAGGGFAVGCCLVATYFLKQYPKTIAYQGAFWCLPSVIGGICMVTLPWSNKLGLLANIIMAGSTYGVTYIIALGWTTSTAAGYTKKLMRNVAFMIGYGVGNIVSPQLWVSSTAPRYYPAWIIQITVSWTGTPAILLLIRWILSRRNKERVQWIAAQREKGLGADGIVVRVEGGEEVRERVDLAMLDLTDLENKYFLYPL